MFSTLTTTLNDSGRGLHAFQRAAELSRQAAEEQPDIAAELFVMAVFAENFVEFHERMAVGLATTSRAADQFVEFATRFEAAVADGKSDIRLAELNAITKQIFQLEFI